MKGRDPKIKWEIVGIYRAPNEDMRVLERLPYADWNRRVDCTSGAQASVNTLVWEHGYTQVVQNPTRGDALLDVYLVRPENLFTSCKGLATIVGYDRK
jgi:hypothetical protein